MVGDTDGFDEVEVNPLGLEVQEYVFPETEDAPILVLCPEQIVFAIPAFALGKGFTVTITESVLVQPVPAVSVR